ncbi:IclR family transcriptional regulator [Spirillospora sp. NPDC029432]|uniref:IclR family transcriptional regulator n=1 Tax=Spirillospora sp. NPDC029432 TaxID=3154599 RepID=UPI0034521E47
MPVPAAAELALESSMLARAARILYSFTAATPEQSMTDVVRRTGLPRSSVHRILDQLVRLKALERSGVRYRLGLGLIELGALAAHQNRLREVALPFLHRLHAATGMPVHLSVLDGHEIVYLEKVGGAPDGRGPSRAGGRQPAYCTAAGKAMLAFAGEERFAEVVAAGMTARTPFTVTAPQVLRRELAGIRERGVALDREENHRGVACVAAPLRDGGGRPVAAISLSGPPHRLDPRALTPRLLTTSRAVWRALFVPSRRAPVPAPAERERRPLASGPHWSEEALSGMVAWSKRDDWM